MTRQGGPDAQRRSLTVVGLDLPLSLRVSTRARRLSLTVDPKTGHVAVVVPPGVPDRDVARFVGRHTDWVRDRLAALPPRLPFADGAVVPYLGVDHMVRHAGLQGEAQGAAPGPVWREPGRAIHVTGQPEHLARRLRDFFIAEARRELSARSHAKAVLIGARVAGVTIRDTRSRWGSCSASGRLNFSWRLMLAPEPVVEYVVCHEVAHLRELNHSPRFWAIVARLTDTTPQARTWLKANGARLHRYG
jgi:predicted metal-dependent hydrolase